MKKGIKESNVQRMRNIVSGNYDSKTKISSGYTKRVKDYKEGDVWEENGKTWTVKRGIKRTVDKLSRVREIRKVPMLCPKCNESMHHQAHKAMFRRWGMCVTCVTKWENKMKNDGVYDEWHSQFDEANFDAFIKDAQQEYEEWLSSRNSKHYITEAGDIEDWKGGKTTKQLRQEFKEQVKQAMESRRG